MLGEVRDVFVSTQEGSLLLGAYALLQEMGPSTNELTVMPLLSIYTDITILYRANIRILLLFAKQYLSNTYPTLNRD